MRLLYTAYFVLSIKRFSHLFVVLRILGDVKYEPERVAKIVVVKFFEIK